MNMRNASGNPNHYAGTVGVFTIKATGVNLKMCEQSWSFDKAEGEAFELREASGLAAVVTAKSNMALRVAADNCAGFFLREHGYMRQFDRFDIDEKYRAYLWGEPAEGRVKIYGACCFRFREYEKGGSYAMQWMWLHPYARRKGHLTAAWPYFRKRFGAFIAEPPYTEAMEAFLAARPDHHEALKAHGIQPVKEERDSMKLTLDEIEMLKESLGFGIMRVRDGSDSYESREKRVRKKQGLSRKLTAMKRALGN
jgi:hypothetical protein